MLIGLHDAEIEHIKDKHFPNYALMKISAWHKARLVDERIAGIISRLTWQKYIRFSCDQTAQVDAIFRAAALLELHGVKAYRLFIYLLVTKDLENAANRVHELRKLKGIRLFAQAERNESKGITPKPAQLEFAQRYIYGRSYCKETWREYCNKRNLLFEG